MSALPHDADHRSNAELIAALASVEQAIAQAPDVAANHRRAWSLYRRLGRAHEALAAARRAVSLAPTEAVAHNELAAAYGAVLDLTGMANAAARAIALAPGLASAHFARAAASLLAGKFAEGWREYEWRLRLPGTAGGIPPDDLRRWDGTPMPDGKLLLFADQGRGDIIQFARYIPWAAQRCPNLSLCCAGEMWPILQQFRELRHLVTHWHEAPTCDAFAPLGSLPMLARTRLNNIPAKIPYLRAEPRRAARWRHRLDGWLPSDYLRVGLIWAGSAFHNDDISRSTHLSSFLPLATVPGVALLALQKGPAQAQAADYFGRAPLVSLGPEIHDFDDTMAVLDAIDLLVSVDTGVVHLAAAMGRPTWVLLPYAPDWRWLLSRDDSPWYPGLRLFRQPAPNGWGPAIQRITTSLHELARSGAHSRR